MEEQFKRVICDYCKKTTEISMEKFAGGIRDKQKPTLRHNGRKYNLCDLECLRYFVEEMELKED